MRVVKDIIDATVDFRAVPAIESLAPLFADPPVYTRIEPQSVSGDPRPGLEAAVHDPLWLMHRQWQFGEFAGEDAGQPLSATITFQTVAVDAFAAGPIVAGNNPARALDPAAILDPVVEAVGAGLPGDLRSRAEAGRLLILALTDEGVDAAQILRNAYPFPAIEIERAPRWLRPILRANPDGAKAAAAMDSGTPAWLNPLAGPAQAAAGSWKRWFRTAIAPSPQKDSWQQERLDYRFAVSAGSGAGTQVFEAPEHLGGAIGWWSFNLTQGKSLAVPPVPQRRPLPFPRGGRAAPGDVLYRAARPAALVQPLTFAGMPADRLWEFEDASVNLGSMSIQANDPARLCLIEYATVYGADWFQVPLDVDAASFTTVTKLTIRDTFNVTTEIGRADDAGRAGRFRLYEVSGPDGNGGVPGLLTLPTAALTIEGPAVESVRFLRDETANMGWAVEETVPDAAGRPRSRMDEARTTPTTPPPAAAGADLRYVLETEVPRYWIPLVPVPLADGRGGFVLRKGTMSGKDDALGFILSRRENRLSVDFQDAELPRDGLRVQRVPSVARGSDGMLMRWTAMRVRASSGPGASGLAYDGAIPT